MNRFSMDRQINFNILISVILFDLILFLRSKSIIIQLYVFESIYSKYLEEGLNLLPWNRLYFYVFNDFYLWWFHDCPFEISFKVVDETDLARLTHAFIICKSSSTKKLCTICDVIEKAYVKEKAGASCTCTTFARIAMNNHNIFIISFEPFIHLVNELEQ